MALITRRPKPDPAKRYEVVQPYSRGARVFKAGYTLLGDHEEVRAAFGQWMLADLPDDEKGRIRGESMWGQSIADRPRQAPPPVAGPATGRYRAIRSWSLPDPDLAHRGVINAGQIVDSTDEVFVRYPWLFAEHRDGR